MSLGPRSLTNFFLTLKRVHLADLDKRFDPQHHMTQNDTNVALIILSCTPPPPPEFLTDGWGVQAAVGPGAATPPPPPGMGANR